MLADRSMTFSQILEELSIPSSHLTYHLENLGELVVKLDDGKYKLSSFGEASVSMMRNAEEVPETQKTFSALPLRWKSIMAIFMVAIVLLAGFSYVQFASNSKLVNDYNLLKNDFEKSQLQNQQLLSWSTSTDRAMSVIRDIIQIDITKYHTTLLSDTIEARTDLGGVVEEVLKYSLVNNEGSLDLVLRFRNNHFSLCQLSVLEGFPSFTPVYSQPQQTDFLKAAQDIIGRYHQVSNDSYLGEMYQILSSAQTTNAEQILGNVKLKTSIFGETSQNSQISLQFTENQVDFTAKSVHLVFENHVLTELSDDWALFTVGSTQINTSQEQAIQVAKNAAKTFSWNANGIQVSNFDILQEPVSAVFFPHPRTDPLVLIPYWYITLYLDKEYPGGVTSIAVGVWADNGQVANIKALSGQATA
jgi:hypothetical protein